MRRNTVVIYDRYVIDFLVDTTRFRIRNNLWLSHLFRFFIKNNHIKIVVLVDPRCECGKKKRVNSGEGGIIISLLFAESGDISRYGCIF